ESGQQLWSFEPETPGLATPVIFDGTVYAGGEGGDLYALDAASGSERWHSHIGKIASARAIGSGGIFFHFVGDLVAVDLTTGIETWRSAVGGIWSSPAVAANTVFAGG